MKVVALEDEESGILGSCFWNGGIMGQRAAIFVDGEVEVGCRFSLAC
jgi:hypothetical protein